MQRNKIYKTTKWLKVRDEVFKLDHKECQRCNHNIFKSDEQKKITTATLVHHIYEAKKFPQYQYSIWVNGKRNLVSLCFDCHEIIHGRKKGVKMGKFTTEERFD